MSKRVTYIEVDLKRCENVYGTSPCTAAIGVTGTKKCFNGLATCQDTPNYVEETETVRYMKPNTLADVNINAIPNIKSVQFTPAKLELGESIGVRATLTIVFSDHRYTDTGPGGDRYLSDRDYNPYERGTYWGKYKARFPFQKSQEIRLIQGTVDQPLATMETRHFVIETTTGPTSSGEFTIVAKDILKLADDKKSKAPMISNGYLSADITDVAGSVTLNPVGIGDSEYPASGYANIGGKEIVSFTRAGDVFTITRAQFNTEAQAHSTDDQFQLCLYYNGEDPAFIYNDLLTTYANISSSYIPLATWESEVDTYIGRVYTALIPEPVAVSKLINELLHQTASTMWWDERKRLIRMRVLRNVDSTAATYSDSVILGGSGNIKDQIEKRVSQVWTYYAQRNPLEPLDEKKNYASVTATIDSDSETQWGEPAVKEIFSRWIPQGGRNAATTLNDLILSRYSQPPRAVGFRLMRDSEVTEPEAAGGYLINSLMIQDDTGDQVSTPIQVTSVKADNTYWTVTAEEVLYAQTIALPDPTVKPINIDTDSTNLNIRTIYDTLYSEPLSGDTINFTIEEGAIVGSTSTSMYSLATGDWPAGITLNIYIYGQVLGKGGAGGTGGKIVSRNSLANGISGGAGGDAIEVTYDCNIFNEGIIGGGGGGGGGGGAAYALALGDDPSADSVAAISGSGGGAGQGYTGSSGGPYGYIEIGRENRFYGNNGGGSSYTGAGNSGASKSFTDTGSGTVATATVGGNGLSGGTLGQAGDAGANGSASVSSSNPSSEAKTSTGGSGGAAGRAIVQDGATATVSGAGDIFGAVV